MREDAKTRISTREVLWKSQNETCVYCGKRITLKQASVDHVIPVFHLEANIGQANLVVSCFRCNKSKGDSIVFSNLYDKVVYPIVNHVYVYQDYYIHSTKKIRKSI